LIAKWNGGFALPPFGKIEVRHFKPALEAAFREHNAEIEKIATNRAPPTFANTILALEKSGWQLSRVASVFWNLEGSDSTPELQEVARDMAPRFAAHETRILLDKRLFKRIDDLFKRRESLKLGDEDRRVLERHHLEFVRAGARLSAAEKSRVKEINTRLATLVTQFMQNVLKDEQSWQLVLEDENDLAGLPATLKESAERAAVDAGVRGKGLVTLARSSVEGFLTFSSRRDLREQAFKAWVKRGAHDGDTDNRQIVAEAVALRGEYARLMGFKSFAEFSLQDTMAKTPDAVADLLRGVWNKAVKRAGEERDALLAEAQASGDNSLIMPWDWRYYAEKVRKAKYDFDEAKLQPYLELDNMIRAAFDCATRLFGLRFKERHDLPGYHPEVRTWVVLD
jgi:peptidyl-dipeptidase Dcp